MFNLTSYGWFFMFLFPCIILPTSGELFQGWRSAIDIVFDLFACFVLFDGILPFVCTKISGISANPIFISVKQIRNCRDIRLICSCHLDMMHQSAFLVHTDMPLVSEMPLIAFLSNALPDLASFLGSLWRKVQQSKWNPRSFLFSEWALVLQEFSQPLQRFFPECRFSSGSFFSE